MTNNIKPNCPMGATICILSGKWKLFILSQLLEGVKRFSQLQTAMPGITQRMLTKQLRELEELNIISRKVYPVVPPKVEYALTEVGQSLKPVLQVLEDWGKFYINIQK
ncbi:winged helix-turn-helix transcriptional regulator [Facilibium subflavum]|uniref:winged helix-turn-helix transcriptional regulator n=1 Tax=Facilibium subflavum TaxID=2219058 RepID=UPI001F2B1EEB|nr:helix-turn-helix domain-containing protein [Facilibium subflavum]